MNKTPTKLDEFLTKKEAAALLRVSLSVIDRMMCRREIPFYKPTGGRVLFKRAEIIAWVEGHRFEVA